MNPNEYLQEILAQQTLSDEDPEMKELRRRRKEIEKLLRDSFPDSPLSIRWGGSVAKGTTIRESYDGDMTCYFSEDETAAGTTLEELHGAVLRALETDYLIEQKASALRVKEKSPGRYGTDLHVDVMPGRFIDDTDTDVFLHRTTGDKERLKTNLGVHIEHVVESGVTEAIRLIKLWRARNGLCTKTFVLELLVIELLKSRKSRGLSTQLEHIWTEFRDHASDLCVEDLANPHGNDLKPLLDQARSELQMLATTTLARIESSGWESVFGDVHEDKSEEKTRSALTAAAVRVTAPTKPWHGGR
ncbi:MAG: hypothetical protein AMXMBFR58_15950 [Phycisphaerae bacterium]